MRAVSDRRPRGLYKAPFDLTAPEKASQTLLSHVERCPYSGALYIKHKGGPQTPAMARGEAFHSFAEQATQMLIDNGEVSMPPEVAKDLMGAILEERVDLAMPNHEQDACRGMAWKWAESTALNPAEVVGVEQMFELVVGNWTIRGKLDLCLIVNGLAIVRDYKTSLKVDSVEDYKQSFQAPFYGLIMLEGVPEGDTVPLGRRIPVVRTEQLYPRYRREEDGQLVHRYAEYDRADLHDFKRTLTSLLAKLDHGLATGEWAAQSGTHCQRCPASSECPIPPHLREVKSVGTPGDAVELALSISDRAAKVKADKETLKAWVDENGEVVVGDEQWGFKLERKENTDKDAVKALIADAGLDEADFFKPSLSTKFDKRRVEA